MPVERCHICWATEGACRSLHAAIRNPDHWCPLLERMLRAVLDRLLPEPLERVRVREQRQRAKVRATLRGCDEDRWNVCAVATLPARGKQR